MDEYITINQVNVKDEHLCCAIADKKHQVGVELKKKWISERISEGHVFQKLNVQGKVFIEYAPLENAWVPIHGDNYIYIYCLWVSGSFSKKGYGDQLLKNCIADAKKQNKNGVCVISSTKKKPFTSDKKYFQKYGFNVVDTIDDYELLALSFNSTVPAFNDSARLQTIPSKNLTIYYGDQCPYINNCIKEIEEYCSLTNLNLNLVKIDSIEKAKSVPCVFNNWAVFYQGKFVSTILLNANSLKKLIG